MTGEISFDLVSEADGDFEEGTYRLHEGEWQVFIFLETSGRHPGGKPDEVG